jgi:hypothetical protein
LILPTGIRFATDNRWCGEDCWIGFFMAWLRVLLFKLLWCVRQTGDDSSPILSFQEMSWYRKLSSEIWKLGSETCRRTGSLVPRYESLVPKHESLVPKLESLVPKHESLMHMDFTAYKRKVRVMRGAYPWASYHQRNSQTRVLQFLRNNLNGIE